MYWKLVEILLPLLGPVGPLQRIRGVGKSFSGGGKATSSTTAWLVVLGGCLVIGGIIGVFAWMQKREQGKARWKQFGQHASSAGLGDEERRLMLNVALGAGVKDPELVFTSEEVFERGLGNVERLAGGANGFGGSGMVMCRSCRFYQSLREKLGFVRAEKKKAPAPTEASLGPLKPGMTLAVVRQQEPQDFEVTLTAAEKSGGELTVKSDEPVGGQAAESWMLRYSEESILWEFSARVVRVADGEFVLKPVSDVRGVDRRRFVRVPVDKAAQIAPFPFQKDNADPVPPEFAPARLVQLAGPGVVLEADMQAKTNDRVLVVLELEDRSVSGLGMIRRGNDGADGGETVAVELVGLDHTQVATLAKETNASIARADQQSAEASNAQPVETGAAT